MFGRIAKRRVHHVKKRQHARVVETDAPFGEHARPARPTWPIATLKQSSACRLEYRRADVARIAQTIDCVCRRTDSVEDCLVSKLCTTAFRDRLNDRIKQMAETIPFKLLLTLRDPRGRHQRYRDERAEARSGCRRT